MAFRRRIATFSPLAAAQTSQVIPVEVFVYLDTVSLTISLATLVQWVMDPLVDATLLETLASTLLVAILRSATPSPKVLRKPAPVALLHSQHV
jgi:hypothetical protein